MHKHERKLGFKFKLLIAAAALLLTVSVSVTAAYLISISTPAENVFTPAKVSCAVKNTAENENVKTVTVENTGNTEAFIRAAAVANFVDDEGGIYAETPILGADYTITLSDEWVRGSDGFYYYTKALPPKASTSAITVVSNAAALEEDYELNVKIIASAIQSAPESVAEETWGAEVNANIIYPK